jgi:hypothetical protein
MRRAGPGREADVGYALAADGVVLLHALFILFAVLGGLLAAWRRWIAAFHLPAAFWAAWIELSGGTCPLTPLENRLRALAGRGGYPGGFVEHYLLPIIYPPGLTTTVQWVLAALVVGVNGVIYGWVLRRSRR